MKSLRLLILFLALGVGMLLFNSTQASAVSADDWKPGRIIDDIVFQNKSSMTVQQIQQFLDSKVPTCDRNGTTTMWDSGYGDTVTRATFSARRGVSTPFTCLKEYVENPTTKENNAGRPNAPIPGGLGAAQLIYNAAQAQNINPQVYLVLLQKEQSLITDDWPWPKQFERATGNHCSDSAPCAPQYAWFWTQVNNAGAQFNYYVTHFDEYNYAPGWNNILYQANSPGCGTRSVYIENAYTAALYIYTPYTPNQAALDNLYGTGDGCSAYGNRNFWRMFNDWFGRSTIPDIFDWSVITTTTDPRYFLVIGNTKRHVPSSELYIDWKLNQKTLQVVTQSYADSIPTLPALGRLGYLDGAYFYIDAGKRIRFTTDTTMKSWGVYTTRSLAAPLYGVLANMTDGGDASFYATPASLSSTSLLVDGVRHAIQAPYLPQWQANPVTLSDTAYQELPLGPTLTNKLTINGVWHVADSNQLIRVETAAQAISWGIQLDSYPTVSATVGYMLPSRLINRVVASSQSSPWYFAIDGKKYYLPSLDHAKIWGSNEPAPLVVSSGLFSSIANASGTVPIYIQDSSSSDLFIMDAGAKRKIATTLMASTYGGQAMPVQISSQAIGSLPNATDMTTPFVVAPNGNVFVASNGKLMYVPTSATLGSLGHPRKFSTIASISQPLANTLHSGEIASPYVTNSGKTYYTQSGYAYELKSSVQDNWTAGRVVVPHPQSDFSTRFDNVSGSPFDNFVQEAGSNFIVSDGNLVGVSSSLLPSSRPAVSTFGVTKRLQDGLLARSTIESDSRVWLLHSGTKQHILSAAVYAAYADGGRILPMRISPSALESFITVGVGENPSTLVSSTSGGFKLLTAAGFYALSNADAAQQIQSTLTPKELTGTLFAQFVRQRGSLNRLLLSGNGKVFIVQNGQKRWIVSSSAYTALQPFGPQVLVDEPVLSNMQDGPPVY